MSGKEIFLKNGFDIVDVAPPDFKLLVKKSAEKRIPKNSTRIGIND